MKKLAMAMILFIISGSFLMSSAVKAEDIFVTEEMLKEYHLLRAEGFEYEKTVTRFEALTTIVKSIGATMDNIENIHEQYGDSYSGRPADWMYADSLLPEFDNRKFESQVEQTRYLNLALFNGIAQGEINGNNRYFYHDRPVTATETMVFMARCLVSKEEMKQYGSDEAKKVALNCGIIRESDTFYADMDSPITPDEFCVMLQRFLNQKRCLYFYAGLSYYVQEDTERSMTYLEYLQDLRKAKMYPEENPYRSDRISVFCDGLDLAFDVPPIKEDDRVIVPMRKIFEVLGASVDWTEETSTVTAIKDKTEISLEIGSNIMLKNGKKIELDVPAKVMHDRTLVPIRAVSEGLGARVEWDEENQVVWIWTE